MTGGTCPACGGAKRFCAVCWRPMDKGDCEQCKPGEPCHTCGGSGEVDPDQLTIDG